jgi:hypothetical protein
VKSYDWINARTLAERTTSSFDAHWSRKQRAPDYDQSEHNERLIDLIENPNYGDDVDPRWERGAEEELR